MTAGWTKKVAGTGVPSAQIWAACSPAPCYWGDRLVVVATDRDVATSGEYSTITGFLTSISESVTFTPNGTQLVADTIVYFNDFSGRSPLHMHDTLRRQQ